MKSFEEISLDEIKKSISEGGTFKEILERLDCFNDTNIYKLQACIIKNKLDAINVKSKIIDYYSICYNEAKKYTTIKDFRHKSPAAYNRARKMGWYKDYTWLKSFVLDKKEKVWVVYVYEIENKYSYIGLTYDIKRRHKEHKRKSYNDSLYQCCEKLGVEIPNYIIIKENLTGDEAQRLEHETKLKYEQLGWSIVNVAKTGVGTGSLGCSNRIWNEQTCYEVAKKCSSKIEFKRNYIRAYKLSNEKGWSKNYTWFKTPTHRYEKPGKSIDMLDLQGNYIMTFSHIRKALDYLGKPQNYTCSRIIKACKDLSKTALGYKWKFHEE